MANSIALAKSYVPNLDEIYKLSSLSAVLTSDAGLATAGAKANEICVPKISMNGLGDYSRGNGYAKGDVTVEYETVKFNFDRGRKFVVDVEDDEETVNVAFGKLGSEFMRTKVAPEVDAFTFATLAGKTGITSVSEDIADGEAAMLAIQKAKTALDEAEASTEGRILFITPTLHNAILALDTYKSREVLANLEIVDVPQSRFYSAIEQKDGTSSGEEIGGYTKATGGKNINFMLVQKDAVIKFSKRVVGNVIPPELNSDSDGYILKFREYDLVDVFENKAAGVYANISTT